MQGTELKLPPSTGKDLSSTDRMRTKSGDGHSRQSVGQASPGFPPGKAAWGAGSRGRLAKPCGAASGAAGGPVWGSARSRLCPHSRGQEAGGFPAPSPPPWARLPHEPPAAAGADGKQGSRRSAGRNLQPGRSSLRGGLLAQGSSSHSAQGLRFVKRPRTAERIKSTPRA